MSAITDTLTARVGGVPTWVYGVGVGGLTLAALAWRDRRRSPADSATPGDTPADGSASPSAGVVDLSGYDADVSLSPSPMGGGTWAVAPRDATDDPLDDTAPEVVPTGISSNLQWQRVTSNWALANGFAQIAVVNGIGGALDGEELGPEELAVVRAVLSQFGAPPDGMPPVRARTVAPVVNAPPPPATQAPRVPDFLIGHRFVKADAGSVATYEVTPTGLRWIRDIPELQRLAGRQDVSAPGVVSVFPASLLRGVPRVGPLPPAGTDASL